MIADREKSELKSLERQILMAENQIEEATSQLFRREAILDKICREIQSAMGFEFAAVQLIRPEETTIESAHGTGIAAEWSGLVKHYLATDPDSRDIQADIPQTLKTEIIAGWDKRFDRWIYDTNHHERLVRIFTPIVVVQDEQGKVIEDWFKYCHWEVVPEENENQEGQHTIIKMRLPEELPKGGKPVPKAIGTVEAGYQNPQNRIEFKQAVELAKLVARRALDIRRALLPYVLETIAESAMRIFQADSTSLHFLYEPNQKRYIYEVCSGRRIGFLKDCAPRKNGLGQQAICEGKPKFIPDPSQDHNKWALERLNPKVLAEGIKAMTALPLLVDNMEGVLYVHFHTEHQFTEDEIYWAQLLANRIVDAIRHATTYEQMRYGARQLMTLHSVTQSLARTPEDGNLLRQIAWDTRNILGADVVNIYEYFETEKRFRTPPDRAGRFKDEDKMNTELNEQDTPFLLVKCRDNVYASRSVEEQIFKNSTFVSREKIVSTAGVVLKVGKEAVGVMFISYRRPHDFSKEEKQLIDTLASSAAIAIKNQRWLRTLSDVEREIITTLDREKLLNLIVQRAVQITVADVGEIRLLDPINQELVTKAIYPADAQIDSNWQPARRGEGYEGITGWVAKHRQSVLVHDVQSDQRYKAYFANIGSELCVPLLDKDSHVLGVLDVESHQTSAFDRGHQRMLEVLANQAVIAIQNLENKEQFVAMERIATLGDLAGTLMHRMGGYLGLIGIEVQNILDKGDEYSKNAAAEIQCLTNEVAEEIESLQNEKPQPVELQSTLHKALSQVHLPVRVTLRRNEPNNPICVFAGEWQLTHVFYNLIQNAKEAMPEGGILSVDCISVKREEGCWAGVKVSDTGLGIAKENLNKIFQPHYSTKADNRGFGLWWTQTYVKRLGGSLNMESSLGEGTSFTVLLPAFRREG